MEITKDMIEQVIEATGAVEAAAEEALTKSNGDVEAAIAALKETAEAAEVVEAAEEVAEESAEAAEEIAEEPAEATEESVEEADEEPAEDDNEEEAEPFDSDEYAEKMVDKLKKKVKAGNVDRIRISREGKTILDIPVNVGIIGGLVGLVAIPWAMIVGAIAAYGLNCKIEIISSDGEKEEL